LFFSNSPFFSNIQGRCMQLGLLGFDLGKREIVVAACCSQFWGRGRVTSSSSLAFIPLLNEVGVFGCWP
jgi:hypothetical protein